MATATPGFNPGALSITAPAAGRHTINGTLTVDETNTRVGIGTTAPEQTLDVRGIITAGTPIALGSAVSQLRVFNSANAAISVRSTNVELQLLSASGTAIISTITNHPLQFYVNASTARMALDSTGIAFYGTTTVAQPSTTGESSGFTAGAGTTVTHLSTFTGNSGTKAYTISDVVKHLKALGLLAGS